MNRPYSFRYILRAGNVSLSGTEPISIRCFVFSTDIFNFSVGK
jgi:hypothetical protein